ncbi:hypothetical protein [Absidia glauca]|uniref:Uncharacterized protein n=1 Tax=Absidia glauca TaxID=4829 RepID=A0A163MX59_ABSGL|nr:hypothetical protein [Absidia glauca]
MDDEPTAATVPAFPHNETNTDVHAFMATIIQRLDSMEHTINDLCRDSQAKDDTIAALRQQLSAIQHPATAPQQHQHAQQQPVTADRPQGL